LLYTYIASCAPVQFRIILDVVVQPMSRFTISHYYTYFAAHLLHGCARAHLLHGCARAHQALLPSYPALPLQFRSRCPVAQPMSRFDIQVLRVFHSAHAAVAKPTFMHQAPLRRLQTTSYHTKIQISRLRDILQGRYTTDPCHYCIASVAAMHYC
jgi:hypothetical protein